MSTIEAVLYRTDEMWTGNFDLLGIVMRFCGLDFPRTGCMTEKEEAEVNAPWERGENSHRGEYPHHQSITELQPFLNSC
ncbi:BZ3500_MvSof-1268-A1-R1_Chr4-2g07190 [Microbotryum saponariae]|uniref:BZ3500_MvSof-1268-A1-R1_Chr4-2g07190 protein n=1 Tax=Microbotryum saponariae TaxID=289078 RepID=A0A2X0MCA0_9BASI|nr:BZ3500_MvSof-1268-A1-R1_Chr4-2g07190 [Microbotryum saponariae]SDA06855.1 BZ3501_MvSof-1269-A2-R1_Chr4-2g06901 [Microbotryum saponariae]